MRPVRRGESPLEEDFDDYADARPHLISRLGPYCSYCERHIVTMLAVEHIQPKSRETYAHLIGRWENFLLACVNCNSTKGNKEVKLDDVLLPDRNNTFEALSYAEDGSVEPAEGLSSSLTSAAARTLRLVGLDKRTSVVEDENGEIVAIDRMAQRMEAWLEAQESLADLAEAPESAILKEYIVKLAKAKGFFSIWMKVFETHSDMKRHLIRAFSGTEESGCFDPVTGESLTPAPNPDDLGGGGRI